MKNTRIKRGIFVFMKPAAGIILMFILGILGHAGWLMAAPYPPDSPKIILMLMDNIDIGDLSNPELKNFQRMIKKSSFGLMNSRVSSIASTDPFTIYASIGAGKKINPQNDPNYQKDIGKIGAVAQKHSKTIAFIGYPDQNVQSVFAVKNLITDDRQRIPESEALIVKDPSFPLGYRTNPEALLEKTNSSLKKSDLVCIDFNDTRRITQVKGDLSHADFKKGRQTALQNADAFIGLMLDKIDLTKTAIMLISPNPSNGMNSWNSNYLTPVIYYRPHAKEGILFSETTKRSGLISYLDIAPTLLHELGIKSTVFQGHLIHSVDNQNSLSTLQNQLRDFIEIKRARYIVHGFYVLCLIIALLLLYVPLIRNLDALNQRLVRGTGAAAASIPVFSIILPSIFRFEYHYLMGAVIIVSVVTTGFVVSKSVKLTHRSFFLSSFTIWIFLTADILGNHFTLLNSPLGFTDVFAGGRYYGINNDCMGILMGSGFYWVFYLVSRNRMPLRYQYGITAAVGIVTTLVLTPNFGANVGGTIAALSTTLLALLYVNGRKPDLKSFIPTLALVLIIELFIAYLDKGSGGQTHAGRALAAMTDMNSEGLIWDILLTKTKLFFLMLVIPPWNLLLLGQSLIFYRYFKRNHYKIPLFYHVLACSALIVLIFNDTGIIAAAIIFTYIMLPLGVELNERRLEVYEYGKSITQRI